MSGPTSSYHFIDRKSQRLTSMWWYAIKNIAFLMVVAWITQSCSNTKFLAEDETLYTHTWFSEKGLGKIKNKPLKAYELYLVGNVKTNRPIFFLPRFNLAIYNYWKPSEKWGPRHYVHKNFSKPPVLLEKVNPEFRLKVMKQRLFEMGHFDSDIGLDVKIYGKNNKKARAKYNIIFKTAYTYNTFSFINQHTKVDTIVAGSMTESLIKPGNDYWLKELENERDRLSLIVRNQGYYFFSSDFLLFNADTTIGQKRVNLTMKLKDDIQAKAYQKYSIRNVSVSVKSNRENAKKINPSDSLISNGVFTNLLIMFFVPM
ncbi:MAG: hypothetical protein R2764_01685 [Bacteroidales bacterium]